MALDVKGVKRVFFNGTKRLEDPDPSMSPGEVKKFFSIQDPELTTANVEGPNIDHNANEIHYTFTHSVGTKG